MNFKSLSQEMKSLSQILKLKIFLAGNEFQISLAGNEISLEKYLAGNEFQISLADYF